MGKSSQQASSSADHDAALTTFRLFTEGLLAACWNSQNALVRKSCSVVLLVPMTMIILFVWTQLPLLRKLIWHKQSAHIGTPTAEAPNHTM